MEILTFDIVGKFAHFRKYYSNSTALSFTLPPRTTVMGILAGMLGKEKDSYYEDFSSDKLRITVSLLASVKKSFHRLNYLKVEGEKDFRGGHKDGHVQTPFEVVSPIDIRKGVLKYRVSLSYFENGKDVFRQIKEKITQRDFHYSLSLGTAFFGATIVNPHFYSDDKISEKYSEDELVEFDSSVDSQKVSSIDFDDNEEKDFVVEEEQLPADFKGNFDREVVKFIRVLFIDGGKKLPVKYTGKYYSINNEQGNVINIAFWE